MPVAAASIPILRKALAPNGELGHTFEDEDHIDPIPGYSGRWLAGFARVGDTQNVVIVQSRYEAISVIQGLFWCALQWSGGLLVCAVAGLLLLPRIGRLRRH